MTTSIRRQQSLRSSKSLSTRSSAKTSRTHRSRTNWPSANKRICGQQTQINIGDVIKDWSAHLDSCIETDKDKSGIVTRVVFIQSRSNSKQSTDCKQTEYRPLRDRSNPTYVKYSDVLIIHKIDNMVLFVCIDWNANIVPTGFAAVTNTVTDDYMWAFCKFVAMNSNIMPRVVVVDFDDSMIAASKVTFIKSKIVYSPWSIYQAAKDVEQEAKLDKSNLADDLMKIIFQTDAKAYEDKISKLAHEYSRDPIAKTFLESIRLQAKLIALWYHKSAFTCGIFGTPKWFNIAKSKLVNEIKSLYKIDKSQKNTAKRQSIYKILTSGDYTDWVFADNSKISEQEFALKSGSDKIKRFFMLNKLKYHHNVLQKICREWLKGLDWQAVKTSKVEWDVKDSAASHETFKVTKKDLAYRCSCYMNNHSGVPCSHILWCMNESKRVDEIGDEIVVHRRFHMSSRVVKEEADSKHKDSRNKHKDSKEHRKDRSKQHLQEHYKVNQNEIYKEHRNEQHIDHHHNEQHNDQHNNFKREILKFNQSIDEITNASRDLLVEHKDPYEMLLTTQESRVSRKRPRLASNTKNKRQKTEHDQTDSMLVNIDPDEQNCNFMPPTPKDEQQARSGYSLRRKCVKKEHSIGRRPKEPEEETYNSVKGEMEYNFNLGLDYAQHSKDSDDVILSNSDPTYKQDDEKSMSDLFDCNNCFNSDWSSLFQD